MKDVDAIMTIRELKKLTDDPRIKHFLHYFWDCEIPVTSSGPLDRVYRYELSKVVSFQDLNEVYETIEYTGPDYTLSPVQWKPRFR